MLKSLARLVDANSVERDSAQSSQQAVLPNTCGNEFGQSLLMHFTFRSNVKAGDPLALTNVVSPPR